MHIVKKKVIQSLLRKHEQEEPFGRLGRIMQKPMFGRNGMGRIGLFC